MGEARTSRRPPSSSEDPQGGIRGVRRLDQGRAPATRSCATLPKLDPSERARRTGRRKSSATTAPIACWSRSRTPSGRCASAAWAATPRARPEPEEREGVWRARGLDEGRRPGGDVGLPATRSKLIDVDNPEKSLLLRKPLNEVKHGGGKKFLPGDQGYKAFRGFPRRLRTTVVKDQYADAARPAASRTEPVRFGTDVWLKLTNTPPEWGDRLLQVNRLRLGRRQEATGRRSRSPRRTGRCGARASCGSTT